MNEITLSEIESIEYVGEVDTYDIHNYDERCLNGEGNFIANNMIVHNSIPDVIRNRDDKSQKWLKDLEKTHQALPKILKDSYGEMVFQEDLAQLWQVLGGFSAVEAQDARKAISKKWTERLKPIEKKWMDGASITIGEEKAKEMWLKMRTFGRYAFNKCLSSSTALTDINSGTSHTVAEWSQIDDKPHLNSYVNGQIVDDQCVDIHFTGEQEIFEVEFSNNQKEHVTMGHKFLCDDGEYHTVRDIIDNDLNVITTK